MDKTAQVGEDRKEDERGSAVVTEEILELGREAGLSACGVLPVGPSPRAGALETWIARGAQGSMDWMVRTAPRRANPQAYWSWAKTALVGALDYLTLPRQRTQAPGLAAFVSRYARGLDYHSEVKTHLRRWADLIENRCGAFHRRALCDTSGVLERDLAARAGLGWIGKNTCLIGPRGNSWRFLGVLMTDLNLSATGPELPPLCGECRACLDACPTGAIAEPWFVDARRCLSYLTIEHRGAIPFPLAEGMGDWLFGCDVCQEVCPWNGKVEPASHSPFLPAPHLTGLDLEGLLALDPDSIRRRFRRTPLERPGGEGILRNALIVGANTGLPAAFAAAAKHRDAGEEGLRQAALWALQRG